MCRARILGRLRLISNRRKSPKQALQVALQDAVSSIKQLGHAGQTSQQLDNRAELFVDRGKAVIGLLRSWTHHQTQVELAELVKGVYLLRHSGELDVLLDTIPNPVMSLESRKSLLNIIRKVARYQEAAKFLNRTARIYPIIQHMSVVLVDLPQAAFGNAPTNIDTGTLQETISRITMPAGPPHSLSYICSLLKIDQAKACGQFTEQAQQTLRKAKIHAEIQLIFYIGQAPSDLPPRVICSSKDACFLCNMFIAMHGKIHTPRCHGKLYPGWRLPSTTAFTVLQENFNMVLQNYARSSLRTLFRRRQRISYPNPNESTLLTVLQSASTSHGPIEMVRCNDEDEVEPRPHIGSPPRLLSLVPSIMTRKCHALTQGEKINDCVEANKTPARYTAGPLAIHIDYSTGPSLGSLDRGPDIAFSVEWIMLPEAQRLQEQQSGSVIEARSLKSGVSHNLGDPSCVYIALEGRTVKIILHKHTSDK
jgi:hypothetical protein